MRCLLLAVTVALACGARGISVPQRRLNLDVQKVAGAWYPMAMVASDTALLSTESAPLRLYVKELRPTAQDGLEIIVHRREDGKCVEKKMFAQKTEAPASFQISNQEDDSVAPVPDQEDDSVAPVPDQEDGSVAPVPDQEDDSVAPVPDQEDHNVAPAAAPQEGKVHVLDTDYENYLFLCMEAAAAAAERSLACQYLARTPKADKEAMEQFQRAMKLFSMRTCITFTPAQAKERCPV